MEMASWSGLRGKGEFCVEGIGAGWEGFFMLAKMRAIIGLWVHGRLIQVF
jgi:hypothetical protein